ncbi:MAG: D-mannonate epimerase, partial [Verrucomicrobiia bacterium]
MLYFERGSPKAKLSVDDLRDGLYKSLARLGKPQRVLVVPPDFTRFHSQAGVLTKLIYDYYDTRLTDVLPALGTHTPMTPEQIAEMYAGVPPELFRVHNWRTGVATAGEVPADFVKEATDGAVDFPWQAQLANLIWTGKHDLILSVGQIV